MAYRIIFEDVKKTIHEITILDSVPNVGDDIVITYRDYAGHLTGDQDAFPVKHRTFGYEKFDRPAGYSAPLDNGMHLTTVHVLLGDPIQAVVFEKAED
ncbi:hypothetical protein LCGC14_2607710 [marine sediment metagenome]|uniref:Uncharacterized protein n=1 Tax=marine sediment metagenome TaxID=412755 RepID=A0A0F9CHX0_9ZZZZ